jgi:hypothetical protein
VNRTLPFALLVAICTTAWAADPLEKDILSTDQAAPEKLLTAYTAKDAKTGPTKKFASDISKIRVYWKGVSLKAGDRIRAIWIASDVGIDAPKDSKITDADVTAYKPDDEGIFALGRPSDGWPLGKYRVELFLNGRLAQSLDFTIEQGVTIEVK